MVENRADGTMDLVAVEQSIREARPGYPPTGLIAIENTHNRCGGTVLPLAFLRDLRALADTHGLPVHMDGARIFNAAAALGIPAAEIAAEVDSVQYCLSKGLAAPVGSIVAGSYDYVQRVRGMRKLLGGAMRQAGVIAAAGIVALETMVGRLAEDHVRARRIAEAIAETPGLRIDLASVQTNIVVFSFAAAIDKAAFIRALRDAGVLVSDYGTRGVRIVTHYQIADNDVDRAIDAIRSVTAEMVSEAAHVPA
jgi:threonine aldolase